MHFDTKQQPLSFSLDLSPSEGIAAYMDLPSFHRWNKNLYGQFLLEVKTSISSIAVTTPCQITTVVKAGDNQQKIGIVMTVDAEHCLFEILEKTEEARLGTLTPPRRPADHSVSMDLFRVETDGQKQKVATIVDLKNVVLAQLIGTNHGLYVECSGKLLEVETVGF